MNGLDRQMMEMSCQLELTSILWNIKTESKEALGFISKERINYILLIKKASNLRGFFYAFNKTMAKVIVPNKRNHNNQIL